MRAKHGLVAALVVVTGVVSASGAMAQGVAPAVLPMQGYLTDGGGAPVDGSTDLTVNLYDGQLSSTVLYGEDQSVMVDAGNFTAYVGDGTPSAGALDMAIFRDNSDVWVGITIGSGTELPRFQLGSVPYAAFAQYSNSAGNATQLGGVDPSSYQNRVTGACGAGEAITAIAADGTVTCATVGDITGVTAGVGITGGGMSGDVTLNINPAVVQSRVTGTCAAGESITAIAATGTVTCSATGDITGVTAGTGLTGGGATGTVTLNADPAYLQRRVSGTCPLGQAIRAVAGDGTVTCEAGGGMGLNYVYFGNWTAAQRLLTLPGYGQVETTGTAGQFRVVSTGATTLMYSVQTCENCAAEEGTLAGGASYTTTSVANTYDQVRIVIQYWNGTGTASFTGTRAGSICSGFAISSI